MNRFDRSWMSVLLAIVLLAGCRSQRECTVGCYPLDQGQINPLSLIQPKPQHSGVTASFDQMADADSVSNILFPQYGAVGIPITLRECICLAAKNSPAANLIEEERNAIRCRGANGGTVPSCVDQFLAAAAEQERNKSAANAAELLLRLAEIDLQRQILADANDKIAEFSNAIKTADENGFATAEASTEVAAQRLALKRNRVKLDTNEQPLILKLNTLIGFEDQSVQHLRPVVELNPKNENLDLETQLSFAYDSHPSLSAIGAIQASGSVDQSCLQLLSEFESRLETQVQNPIVRRRLLRVLQREQVEPDPTREIRQQQLAQIQEIRRKLVRQDVIDAVAKVQSTLQEIALETEDLKRLVQESDQIEAATEIDAQDAYFKQAKNWAKQQQAKSKRVSTLIEHEIAKIRLLESQGQLGNQACGF